MADQRSKRARMSEERATSEPSPSSASARQSTNMDSVKEALRAKQEERQMTKLLELQDKKSPKKSAKSKTSTPQASASKELPGPTSAKSARKVSSKAATPPSKIDASDAQMELETTSSLKYENFVLDCDGVVWHGKEAIGGSIEAIRAMYDRGCGVHFVTNSSSSSRKDVARRLNDLGLPMVTSEMITTSGSAAAMLIRLHFPNVKRVYVIGEEGLMEELRAKSLTPSGGPADNDLVASNETEFRKVTVDSSVQLVVCGLDRRFSYGKLSRASLYLQKGLPLVCTNLDAYDVLPDKGNVPGAGCIVAALRASNPSMAEPKVAGKPSGEMLLDILTARNFRKAWTVMVGDRVDTDIECAKNAGVASCLVLSGVSKDEHADSATHCFADLASFAKEFLSTH